MEWTNVTLVGGEFDGLELTTNQRTIYLCGEGSSESGVLRLTYEPRRDLSKYELVDSRWL